MKTENSKMCEEDTRRKKSRVNNKKWLAYAAASAVTTAVMSATTPDVCAQVIVRNPAQSLLPADVTMGTIIGGFGGLGSRARFSSSLNGNGQIVLDAIHPFSSFGRLLGAATGGARFFGQQLTTTGLNIYGTMTSTGLFNFPANAELGARFSTLQTRSVELSATRASSLGSTFISASALADPIASPSRTNHQFGQTYLATSPASQDAYLAFTFDDAAGQQFGFIRLSQVRPGAVSAGISGTGGEQFGLNGVIVEQIAFTTAGQDDLDRGFAVGVVPTSVPEPGSMAVLALGALGVAAWRRKRQ